MAVTTISSREFNQDTGRAKKATENGPVFITARGRAAHVLLNIEQYRRLAGKSRNIADALAMTEDMAFEPPRLRIEMRTVDLG